MLIYLDNKSVKYIKKIVELLDHEALFNCNFANTSYSFCHSEFGNYIENYEDEQIASDILNKINYLIEQEINK